MTSSPAKLVNSRLAIVFPGERTAMARVISSPPSMKIPPPANEGSCGEIWTLPIESRPCRRLGNGATSPIVPPSMTKTMESGSLFASDCSMAQRRLPTGAGISSMTSVTRKTSATAGT
jgi:hypothetical protein